MTNKQRPENENAILRIAGLGASLAFGGMVASLFALKPSPNGFSFELNAGAVISFLAAATMAWFYWRMVARMAADKTPEQRKKKFIAFSGGLILVGIVSFLYPLKFIAVEKRWDVFVGLTLAVCCLAGIGFVMWKVKRFLDADLKKSQEEEPPEWK